MMSTPPMYQAFTDRYRPGVGMKLPWCIEQYAPGSGLGIMKKLNRLPSEVRTKFTKQLYSSDAFALAELHYLGALLFRRSLAAILEDWVRRDECSAAETDRIAELLGRANARRIYPLGDG